ncbi:MAG: hypothetical protein CL912_07755 [Deltaproteobacteria bacterium]|nr:hypothetical protein [Deltaproteobacteria bacterium]
MESNTNQFNYFYRQVAEPISGHMMPSLAPPVGYGFRECGREADFVSDCTVHWENTLARRFIKTAKQGAGISSQNWGRLFVRECFGEAGFEAYCI